MSMNPKQTFDVLKNRSNRMLKFAEVPVTPELAALLTKYGYQWPNIAIELEDSFEGFGQRLLQEILHQSPAIPETMKTEFFTNEEWFYVGTLTTYQFNAHSQEAENGGWLIIFNAGTIALLYNLARTLVSQYRVDAKTGEVFVGPDAKIDESGERVVDRLFNEALKPKTDIENQIKMISRRMLDSTLLGSEVFLESGERIIEMLMMCHGLGIAGMRTFPLELSQLHLASDLASFAEKFILSHELAHHIMGHVNPTLHDDNTMPLSRTLWDKELEADRIAFRLVLEGLEPSETIYAYMGIELSLHATWLVEHSYQKIEGERPSGKTRLEAIREIMLERTSNNKDKAILLMAVAPLDLIFSAVRELFPMYWPNGNT